MLLQARFEGTTSQVIWFSKSLLIIANGNFSTGAISPTQRVVKQTVCLASIIPQVRVNRAMTHSGIYGFLNALVAATIAQRGWRDKYDKLVGQYLAMLKTREVLLRDLRLGIVGSPAGRSRAFFEKGSGFLSNIFQGQAMPGIGVENQAIRFFCRIKGVS